MTDAGRRDPLSGRRGIRLAFLPWIVYWILWPFEVEGAALLAPLGLALVLNLYRGTRGRLKLMEVTTLAFFTVGAAATLLFEARAFVRSGLLLGHATLAAMAMGSLLAGSPFIAQYVRDEWPPQVAALRVFRAATAAVTWLWGAIFVLSALLQMRHLGVPWEARLFIPPLLVLAGGLLSSPVSRWYVRAAAVRASDSAPS